MFRPTLQIPVAGDYPYRFDEGYWFRVDLTGYVYIRGKVPISVGQLFTWHGVIFTVEVVYWLDNGEMKLAVTPPASVALGESMFAR